MTERRESPITAWLSRAPANVFALYATFAAFSCYLCMYAFRKPIAAAKFADQVLLGLDAKTVFLIAQVLGYAASKFLGIKIVSELDPKRRARSILMCMGAAELALLLFAVLPNSVAAIAMIGNGLSLGMIWGMVFGFLEGRRTSDMLGAGLCASFIVGSGLAKSAGVWLLGLGVSEKWMPAATGLLFTAPMLLCIFLLSKLPPPTAADQELRVERAPMDGKARKAFFGRYAVGLVLLVGAYVLLTALRDFRDNFGVEIWQALGYKDAPAILTTTEIPVAVVALLGVAAIGVFRSNRRALLAIHGLLIGGALVVGASTLAFRAGLIGPVAWMITLGIGLYVAYVPYNCILFDRLVAAAGSKANAGFLIYVADASGYAGSVVTQLYKSLGQKNLSWVSFLETFTLVASVAMAVAMSTSAAYFSRRIAPAEAR